MENIADSPIIADTSALVSLATDTDHNHIPAKEAAAQLREGSRPIILPADIFVETINVLGKRSGHERALKAAAELLRPGSQFVLIETISYLHRGPRSRRRPLYTLVTSAIGEQSTGHLFKINASFSLISYSMRL